MSEGQRKARNCQRWLMAAIIVCFPATAFGADDAAVGRLVLAMFIMATGSVVIEAMRALAEDRA